LEGVITANALTKLVKRKDSNDAARVSENLKLVFTVT
jgi:hypothetical protein